MGGFGTWLERWGYMVDNNVCFLCVLGFSFGSCFECVFEFVFTASVVCNLLYISLRCGRAEGIGMGRFL